MPPGLPGRAVPTVNPETVFLPGRWLMRATMLRSDCCWRERRNCTRGSSGCTREASGSLRTFSRVYNYHDTAFKKSGYSEMTNFSTPKPKKRSRKRNIQGCIKFWDFDSFPKWHFEFLPKSYDYKPSSNSSIHHSNHHNT